MNAFSAESLAAALAIIGAVIIVSALLSGLIERSGLPQVAVFLGLGAALGPFGLQVLNISLESPTLRAVSVLSLSLVLFTDAVSLNITEVRRRITLAFRLIGPGTLLNAAVIAATGCWVLGLPVAPATILGAALASSDPVLLRGLLRRRDIPAEARHALQLESGLNDVVLLPVVLIAMAFMMPGFGLGGGRLAKLGLDLFVLGPGAGILIGLLGVAALDLIRKKIGIRRDYESLYSLGVAFTAFAAAEAVHGSGFLAAFAAGITIAALDVELCDCFVEYGEVTAEMLLLFTFVLLGSSLIWYGLTIINGPMLLFTAVAVLIRTPIYLVSLIGSGVDMRARRLIAWFGPRGLSSLLLILLPVFAGLPGSEQLFSICSLVVLVSVILHGGSPMLLAGAARRRAAKGSDESATETPAPDQAAETAPSAAPTIDHGRSDGNKADGDTVIAAARASSSISQPAGGTSTEEAVQESGACGDTGAVCDDGSHSENVDVGRQRISIDELRLLWQAKQRVVILDVRTTRTYDDADAAARGAIRMPPDHVVARAKELGLDKEAWLVAFCT
jgi:NhaP-type Na+/H+ or K+/H+ antiporter